MKNKFYLIICLLLLTYGCVMAQSVEINPASSSSAIISSTSTNKGLLVPRMTDTQRAAIASPATGLMVYQTNATTGFYFWNGTTWVNLGGSGGTASELQKITEGSNTGWRILGRDAANYGDIGGSAVDFSRSITASTIIGATGNDAFTTGFATTASGAASTALGNTTTASANNSIAMGFATTASGHSSTAMGNSTRATQYASTAMGNLTRATGIVSTANGDEVRAKSFGEFAIGSYNDTLTTVNSTTFAGDNNRIFTVGTGTPAARRTSFVVQQNGNVGIGASSPNAQLQLGNTIANRKVVLFEFANNDHQYYGIGINNQVLRYQVDANVSSHAFFAGSSASTSNELMRITGTGNVGIGTTAPNAPLQFANIAANRKIVLFDGLNNDHQYFGFGINTSMLRYQVDGTASVHAFFSGATTSTSTELMRITGTGNVGIGTNAPSEKLDVAGSVRIVDGTQGDGKVLTSDANGKATWTTIATGGTASELQKITEASNTGWRILGRDPNYYGNIGNGAIDLSYSSGASTTLGATGAYALATGDETTASGDFSTASGIGTTASGNGSTAMGSVTTSSGSASTSMGVLTKAQGTASFAAGLYVNAKSYGEFAIGSYNDTLTTVNSTLFAGDNNRIFTVGTGTSADARRTSFVVQQNGNVGVGASSPNAQLQLGNSVTNRKVVLFEVANNDHQYYGLGINNQIFRYQVDNTISSHAFYAATSTTASNELMRITGTGNVGIGTTAPSERLDVVGSVKIVDGTQGVGKVLTSDANGKATWTTPAAGGNSSELQKITEGSNTGWRILGRDAANHGDIGANALDLSRSTLASTTTGATGPDAFAAGFVTTASGTNSTAMGNSTNASGMFSTAMGSSSIASGQSSTAIGSSTTASGQASTAMGISTTSSGQNATAMGSLTTASGGASTAMGSSTIASGPSSTAMGDVTIASGNRAIAMGQTTIASGDASTAMGISTRATQYASTAMGAGSRATGVVSTAIGNELIAKSATEFVVGSFNDTLTTFNATGYVGDNNRTFTVGTGSTNTARRTSFVVQQNGNVGIGNSAPTERLDVAGSIKIVDGTQGAGKVLTSDANGRGTWTTPTASVNTSELQKITEGSKTGWRILGRNAANYGDIGIEAIDLSRSITASTTIGATGRDGFATGYNTTAAGDASTAMGISTSATQYASTAMGVSTSATQYASTAMGAGSRATGVVSTAIGNQLVAKSATEFVVGSFNDTLTTFNATAYVGDNNRTFTVGTGSSNTARRTSFVVQQNGNVGIGASVSNAPLQFANSEASRKVVLFEVANNDHQFYGFGVNAFTLRYQVNNIDASHVFFTGTSATASTELMRITGTGNVGIGTAEPIERLHVIGNILASGTITQLSDLRYKKNFSKIENPLNKVLSLNGLHYDWKVEEFKENNFTKDRQIGFIAQEIEEIFPEMVLTDAKGYKSVDYARLTPVLVEAIKELKTLNDELKGKNEKLEANSQKLEARLDKIEALLNR
ncbi:MAG: tail fiber domain-containing protein [Leadbetterella sp.]|nr:tail fiber domain-containing protein [Leadbetterella sp.]